MKIRRSRKKYTKRAVLSRVCKYEKLIKKLWPKNKKLTTLAMVKIAVKNRVDSCKVDDLILVFDNRAWGQLRVWSCETKQEIRWWSTLIDAYIKGEIDD